MRINFTAIGAVGVATALVGLLATNSAAVAQFGEPTAVGVDKVVSGPLNQTMPVIGRLVARRTGVVSSRINGPIGRFLIEVGDRVGEGDVIAELVDDSLASRRDLWQAELSEARSAVGTRRAELKLRHQELTRIEKLRNSSAFNPAQLDDKRQEAAIIESEIGEYRAAVAIAEANLRLAEINLYNARIRAPYGGVVSARHTETGSYVQVGDPVVTLIDDQSLEIEADVPTDRVPALMPGTQIRYWFSSDAEESARVRAIIPDENPLTRTRSVRFAANLPDGAVLAANQSVTLRIPVGAPRTVVSVHKDAILERAGQKIVYVATSGVAELRPVVTGDAVGDRFEVIEGLAVGDIVVVRGNERLMPGQLLSFPDIQGQS